MAALAMFPGIRFDPREPVPPRFAHLAHRFQQQAEFDDDAQFDHDGHMPRGQHGRVVPGNFARVDPYPPYPPYPQQPVRPNVAPDVRRFEPEEPQLRQGFLAPLSSSVKVQIVHDTAKFTVVHLFWNQSNHIKQGTYQFPLPLDATVTEYNCRIGANKIVRGKVRAKEDARREFDDAVRQGRTGGLVEQQTAEIFTINLANIPANTKMRAELSFMCLLKHRVSNNREVFTLTVPTFIAPRYGDVPQGVRVGNDANHFLSLEVDVLTAEELITVNSDTHNILFERNAGQRACQTWDDFVMRRDNEAANLRTATVQLEQGRTSLDKDMVISITTALSDNRETPQACVEVHPEFEHHKALMLTLPSDYLLTAANVAHDGEIIFLADRSGSMYDKVESLKSAMMFFINGIPENRPFNIWCFGSECTYMWPRSRPLNENTRQEAINYVRNEFAANMGGTDILPALRQIYESRGGYHSMDIVVLTDGQVWEPQDTIAFVEETRLVREGLFRCFSLGIGYAVSHELVEGIAKAGGGYAEVITDARGGGWEDRVVAVLKAAVTGHIRSVQMELQWHGEEGQEVVHPPEFKQSPAEISAISPFVRNRVFLLFDSGQQCPELEAVALNIRGPDGTVTTKRVLPKRLLQPDVTIHKLAVRALLGDLERGESWLQQQNRGVAGDAPLVRQEAIDLGCKWSLVSKWTSLYAVEEETDDAMPELHMEIRLPEIDDDVGDALLLPRGAPNQNAGLLLGQGGAAVQEVESGTESDGSSGAAAGDDYVQRWDSGSDDDSDDGDGNDGPEGGAGAAGRRDGDAGGGGDGGGAHGGGDGGDGGDGGAGDEADDDDDDDDVRSTGTGYMGDSGAGLVEYGADALQGIGGHAGDVGPAGDLTDEELDFGVDRPDNAPTAAAAAEAQGWESTASREPAASSNPSPYAWPSASTLSNMSRRAPVGRGQSLARSGSPLASSSALRPPVASTSSQASPNSYPVPPLAATVAAAAAAAAAVSAVGRERSLPGWDSVPPPRSRRLVSTSPLYASLQNASPPPSAPMAYFPGAVPLTLSPALDLPSQASAPVFNPPASSYVMESGRSMPKTDEELAAEKLVGHLLGFQKSDGSFVMRDDKDVKAVLGSSFLKLLTKLKARLNDLDGGKDRAEMTTTVAVVALLEEQFQGCRALWVLMVGKAKDFIAANGYDGTEEVLLEEAKTGVKRMASVVDEMRRARELASAIDKVVTAPVVA
ncbi:von Willebrand factor type A domain-containing protein [Tolypocladium paradoxum]|uniref:von Willebrand factor type A domain-containing protein n=1 Tax=Tolypocladium paradoxum TaxID=94208 RepID=A0A2S4L4Q1_9HYPO|nr:von Willebrand factor type A domain-containing protein [Tolypocladium paradoxum]